MSTTNLPVLHVTFAISFLLTSHIWVNYRQPNPYMDELFHVPQAQQFCLAVNDKSWPSYHPAITTLPGVYIQSAAVSAFFRSQTPCETRWLRAFSAMMALLCLPLLAHILAALRARTQLQSTLEGNNEPLSSSDASHLRTCDWSLALILWLNPVFLFYSHLYYTDTSAMAWILLSWALLLQGCHTASAIAGIAATMIRQTNMIWHAFLVADFIIYTIAVNQHAAIHFFSLLSFIVRGVFPKIWAHICAGLMYSLFLIVNGGVVVGDKENHTVSLHYAMFVYFLGFQAISHAPFQMLQPRQMLSSLRKVLNSSGAIRLASTLAAVIALVMATGDKVHPFILADNRHYTFYIYRRWLLRSNLHRLALTPLYLWTIMTTYEDGNASSVKRKMSESVSDCLLFLCAAVALVPSALLEPRYFLIGSTLLSLRRLVRVPVAPSPNMMMLVCGGLLVINVGLVFVFAELPFARAVDEHMPNDDSMGRFMF